MISDDKWYDQMWNPITGVPSGNIPITTLDSFCRNSSGDVRFNMSSPLCKITEEGVVLEEPFESKRKGHYLLSPCGSNLTFHKYRLKTMDEKYKVSHIILVCPMSDIFDYQVSSEWLKTVLDICYDNPRHIYIFTTRYLGPALIKAKEYNFPKNWWFRNVFPDDESDYKEYRVSHNSLQGLQSYIIANNCNPKEILDNVNLICHFNRITNDNVELLKSKFYDFNYGYKFATVSRIPNDEKKKYFLKVLKNMNILFYFFEDKKEGVIPKFEKPVTLSKKQSKKLIGKCAMCHTEKRKGDMYTIFYRRRRGESTKRMGYICEDCFNEFTKQFTDE